MSATGGFGFFVVFVFPYLSVPLYLLVLGYRIWTWAKQYNPAVTLMPGPISVYRIWTRQYRPTIDLFPRTHARRGTEAFRFVKGMLLFSGLFKQDRALWLGAWPFHAALLLVAVAHLRMLLDFSFLTSAPGVSSRTVDAVFAVAADAGGTVLVVSSVYLLVRRLLVKRAREVASAGFYAAGLLILAVAVTGCALRVWSPADMGAVRAYAAGLVTFSGAPPPVDPVFVWHLLLSQALLLYMPFSHLMHFGGIFLSRAFLRSSDSFAGTFGEKKGNKRGR